MHSGSSDSFLQEDGKSKHYQRHHPQADQGTCYQTSARVEQGAAGEAAFTRGWEVLVVLPVLLKRSLPPACRSAA